LQRTYEGSNITDGSFVAAFRDAASFNLGLIATYSGIGLNAAEKYGGLYNALSGLLNSKANTSGFDGNNPLNARSIVAGSALALRLGGTSPTKGLPRYFQVRRVTPSISNPVKLTQSRQPLPPAVEALP